MKKTVDEVVDKLEELPVVRECYDQWCRLQSEIENYYHDKPREKKKLSQEKEFRQIKNAVIREAERIRLGEISFEDDDLAEHDEPEQVRDESNSCWELRQIIQDASLPLAERDEAAIELERLAEQGDAHAQYLLGQLYRDGPLLVPDSQRATYWFTQAAERGLTEAQYALGKLLLSDDWEARDPGEGIRWLKKAAQNGSHYAAYRLGKLYLQGEAVPKDAPRAVEYLTAAEAGNQYAQYVLGKLYLAGQEVPQDRETAWTWFCESASQGNQYAQFFVDHFNDSYRPNVLLAATKLLHHMSQIFRENSVPPAAPMGQHIDRKRWRKLQEKRIALGHKPDDHEEAPRQDMGGMTMGW